MMNTLKTLFSGASARAEDRLRDAYALELIDQKIKETADGLQAAKQTLASLIQQQRSETRMLSRVTLQQEELTIRATAALEAGDSNAATRAAEAIADLEYEATQRQATLERLSEKIGRLETAVHTSNRRLVSLKQGAITARAIRRERKAQAQLGKVVPLRDSAAEAEDLIARVTQEEDTCETAEILSSIDADLRSDGVADSLAAQGYGPSTKSTAADVLARLKTQS